MSLNGPSIECQLSQHSSRQEGNKAILAYEQRNQSIGKVSWRWEGPEERSLQLRLKLTSDDYLLNSIISLAYRSQEGGN